MYCIVFIALSAAVAMRDIFTYDLVYYGQTV